nr:MAG TPA: hypothetical protein [Caudoviricetes sp.]
MIFCDKTPNLFYRRFALMCILYHFQTQMSIESGYFI